MINDIIHARSYARDLKRQLKPYGVGHLAAYDMAARSLGARDWREIATRTQVSADRSRTEASLRAELAMIAGVDPDAVVATLLPPPTARMETAPAVTAPDNVATPAPRAAPTIPRDPDALPDPLHAFDGAQLHGILETIRLEPTFVHGEKDSRIDDRIAEGWFPRHAVHDILHDWDGRLRSGASAPSIATIMASLGYAWTNMCHRPGSRDTAAGMHPAMRAADFASLAIQLERLGFRTPAALMVDRLLPVIKARKSITQSELNIHWYPRESGRFEVKHLAPDVERGDRYEEGRLPLGHRYEAVTGPGVVRSLTIRGPRHRRRRN